MIKYELKFKKEKIEFIKNLQVLEENYSLQLINKLTIHQKYVKKIKSTIEKKVIFDSQFENKSK